MTHTATLHIGIVGTGPSGCYLADALLRKMPNARIDMFDRLPTPFGLVRGGVAPDHQGTKNITRQFERTFAKDNVRFLGHVDVGRDVSVAELQQAYDIIAIATGALEDRPLGIPGEALPGVYGSGAFVGWYNGIPDYRDLAPKLDGNSVAIVGNGNVALDIARLLAKTPDELANSDMCAHARDAFARTRIQDIWLIGRRGPLEANFTTAELSEFGHMARLHPAVYAGQLPKEVPDYLPDEQRKLAEKNLEVLREFSTRPAPVGDVVRLHFLFNAAPVAIVGEVGEGDKSAIREIELEHTRLDQGRLMMTGERRRLPAQTVISAIGYRSRTIAGVPFDVERGIIANDQGRVAPGIYAAGWCKRGPQGVVPANRADALAVAEMIAADFNGFTESSRPGGSLVDALLKNRQITSIDFAGWQRINNAEVAAGSATGRPREKISRLTELLAAAQASSTG